jgi:hypothetical protein
LALLCLESVGTLDVPRNMSPSGPQDRYYNKLVIIINYLLINTCSLGLDAHACYGALLKLTNGRQLRAARALLGWDQAKLAKTARVAIGTIRRMESFDAAINSQTGTLYNVQQALERGGIEFLNDERPGVRLRMPVKRPG